MTLTKKGQGRQAHQQVRNTMTSDWVVKCYEEILHKILTYDERCEHPKDRQTNRQ